MNPDFSEELEKDITLDDVTVSRAWKDPNHYGKQQKVPKRVPDLIPIDPAERLDDLEASHRRMTENQGKTTKIVEKLVGLVEDLEGRLSQIEEHFADQALKEQWERNRNRERNQRDD